MICIVIPVFNRLNFTVECIKSLQQQTYTAYKIIVADDGSTDGTADYINQHFPDVLVVKGDGNLWWTGATNLGVEKAMTLSGSDTDFILTLNNDLVVKEDYLQSLINVAAQHPKALIGSVSLHIDKPDTVHFAGTKWNSKWASYRSGFDTSIPYPTLQTAKDAVSTDLLPGRGILIPVKAFREIGLYDIQYFPHYMADEDFSLRAKKAGYELLISTKAAVYNHVNETGLKKRKKDWQYYKDVFTSIKSPVNSKYRWHWAKRHATIYPPVYFTIDMARIAKSLIFNR